MPWGLQQRHKLAKILNCTDLVTVTGTDISISSCLVPWLAASIINREQELSYGRVKRNGEEEENFVAHVDFQRRQKIQI